MKSFAHYCQNCRAANVPGEDLCHKCGTQLMLVVVPTATRNESQWQSIASEEHLLERISMLEVRMGQVADRLCKAVDIMLKQARTLESEHLLVETLIDALNSAGVLSNSQITTTWRDKQKTAERAQAIADKREQICAAILQASGETKVSLFVRLIKEGFRLIGEADEKQGLRQLEKAVLIEPRNAPLLAFVGTEYFLRDQRPLARDYLLRASQQAADNTVVNLLLGVVSLDAGDSTRAGELLEPLLDIDKNLFPAAFALGVVYAVENRPTDALAWFKRAHQINPTAETNYLVGSTYAELGRPKLAVRYLTRSVELDADYADALYMLGLVYLRTGDEAAARESLSRAMVAREAGAQCHAILKNPKNLEQVAQHHVLLFARLSAVKQNVLNSLAARLNRLLRESIETFLREQQ